jgi:hypothetical protein
MGAFDAVLVDARHVCVVGVGVVGGGRARQALDLVDSRATPSEVTIQVYRPTGRPKYATATT